MAVDREYRHHRGDIPDRVSDSEHTERDARAIHLKLDEIIRAIQPARNSMINIEALSDQELQSLSDQFERIRTQRGGGARKRD